MTEWKTYRLGDVIDKIIDNRGRSAPTSENRFQPIIEINSLGGRNPDYTVVRKWVSEETYNTWFRSGHPVVGDILIPTVGTIGIVSMMNENRGCIAQNVIALRVKSNVCGLFIYYYLKSDVVRQQLLNLNIGGVQPSIKVPHLLNLEISLPSLEEQRRIAGILGAIDDKIENNRRINANLELQAQALYKQWFVDFEFPNEEGKPYKSSGGKMVDSELGQIPDGWNNIRFSKFCHLSNDRVGGLCVSDYSITNNGITPRGQKYTKQLSQNRAENKLLRKGNLAFGMSRDILNWGIMKDEIGAVSPAYTVYTIGDIDATYLELYIQSHIAYFRDLIKPAAREGQSIDKGVLNNKMLYYPPKHLLRAFLAIFNSISNNFCIKENENLATLRDTLLPKLMNGEIKM